jgi:hypothetical protein
VTVFIRPEFTPNILHTFNGYHLQIFAAGRAKISLQTLVNNKKHEFYTALPKKDREALRRQKARSLTTLPDHYAAVDQLLSDHPDAKVFRVHAKGDNNATADNAHVLASLEQEALWLVMSGVVHRWELTTMLVHVLLEGKGKRTGEASILYEYVPTQEHDWQDATFELADYKTGPRITGEVPAPPLPKAITPQRPPAARRVHCQKDEIDDYDDPILFTDPPDDAEEKDEFYASSPAKAPQQNSKMKTSGSSYKDQLWAEVRAGSQDSRAQS